MKNSQAVILNDKSDALAFAVIFAAFGIMPVSHGAGPAFDPSNSPGAMPSSRRLEPGAVTTITAKTVARAPKNFRGISVIPSVL
ncbi:MAG: hypothetical protein ACREKL_00475 [Chthoniobacterales bacterium]